MACFRRGFGACIRRIALVPLALGATFYLAGAMAQSLPPELQKAWAAARIPSGDLSLHVQDVDGRVLISHQAMTPRNPASVMKMVTTWAALSGLGPDYVWRTTLSAQKGAVIDQQGSLKGPLYIQAAGDPMFPIDDLWDLLRQLRLRGIKNLNEVVIDRSLFGPVTIDPGDFDDSPDRPYNASPDAMMVNFGASRLLFQPDAQAKKWIAIVDPPTKNIRIEGQIGWSDVRCPGSPVISTRIEPRGTQSIVHVQGTAAGSCGEFSVYRLALGQSEYFASMFRLLWKELGGTLARDIVSGTVPGSATPLVWHDSPALADVIRQINKRSNNVMARMLLLTLGAEMNGRGATAQSAGGSVLQLLHNQGVDTTGWTLDNGSGLSRSGRVTAQGLAGMLQVAWRSALMPEFVSSLAISGVDGTVRRRLRDESTRGQAHLKTGTLRDARALAGYVRGASGKRYILVSMVNGPNSAGVRAFDDALVRWLTAQ
ncbi:D-alanyl-D-alanine carboxypeptidase/D-alanyl-D-alanine-endopeptidase [Alcaligenaceae bacterium CGII-47]|nr:D-alanyl-D-alanine carboxypeptidase/D-alanyl-D-alanine-endopeptidase [Alcaligenaceae bacterium CGII-47]